MSTNKYKDYSNDQLLDKIKQLEKKRYGLVWEDRPEEVADRCDRELPVLVHQPDKEITENPGGPTNLLIEGDNYHALFALNFTHRRKIDLIYIDPPYNTGEKTWKYNNAFVDSNDRYRHSKWLSMMSKRLRLAKNLLTETGIICVTIDDYEVPRLTILMEEIFGESNHLGTVPIRNNPSGRATVRGFAVAHEYALFFSRTDKARIGRLQRSQAQLDRYDQEDEHGNYEWVNFRKHGAGSNRDERRKMYYPIFSNQAGQIRMPQMEWNSSDKEWILLETPTDEDIILFPDNEHGEQKAWNWGRTRVENNLDDFCVRTDRHGKLGIYVKSRVNSAGMLPLTWFDRKEYFATEFGTNLLTRIFGKSRVFPFPKSLFAVIDCIRVLAAKQDAIILDFFAGSGTTGQAVLELNNRDGGSRRFILSTNNESGVAEEVCYERIKHVINGKSGFDTSKLLIFEAKLTIKALNNIENIFGEIERLREEQGDDFEKTEIKVEDGFLRVFGVHEDENSERPANLKYFTTDFVPNILTDNDKRVLVSRSTELLCIAEDTFEKVSGQKDEYAIFKNATRSTAIVYDEDAIEPCIDELNKIKPKGKTTVYVFSYDQDYDHRDFEGLKIKFKVKPIPEAILNVYRRNAKLRKK